VLCMTLPSPRPAPRLPAPGSRPPAPGTGVGRRRPYDSWGGVIVRTNTGLPFDPTL
jgi:hypothetical protein